MTELLASILPILIVDVLNPVLLGLLVFAAGSARPLGNSSSLLLGHTVAYFAAGVAVSFGIEGISAFITDMIENPKAIDFVLSLLIGAACLYYALRPATKAKTQDTPEWELTPLKCFGFGAVVNFIGVPFALPYFAAVGQILKADLTLWSSLTALSIYNVGYALPFAIVPVAVLIMGDRSKPMLQNVSEKMANFTASAMPWFLGLLGLFMSLEAVYFFLSGKTFI